MDLLFVNHYITAIKAMLQNLVDENIISDVEARTLFPEVFKVVMKNEVIEIEVE